MRHAPALGGPAFGALALGAAASGLLLTGCGSTTAAPAAAPASPARISVTGAYIPLPASPDVAAAYFDLGNSGGSADRLTGVSTPAAQSAALNESTTTSMQTVSSVEVPAHGGARFARGGTHVMLMGLTSVPKLGQTIELTLTFEHTGKITVRATVEPLTYQPPK